LALRFAQSEHGDKVHNYILLAPAIPSTKVTEKRKPGVRKIGMSKWKLIGLTLLNAIGITWFNTTIVSRFEVAKDRQDGTETDAYDFNLLMGMHPKMPFLYDAEKTPGTLVVLAGREDERLEVTAYADLFSAKQVTILPGIDHKDICRAPGAIAEIKKHL
jgi:hypothetical protein